MAPSLFVHSSQIAPVMGEDEPSVTTCIKRKSKEQSSIDTVRLGRNVMHEMSQMVRHHQPVVNPYKRQNRQLKLQVHPMPREERQSHESKKFLGKKRVNQRNVRKHYYKTAMNFEDSTTHKKHLVGGVRTIKVNNELFVVMEEQTVKNFDRPSQVSSKE